MSLATILAQAFVDALQEQDEDPYLDKENDLTSFVIDGRCDLVAAMGSALGTLCDPRNGEMTEAIGRALATADWYGEWPLPAKISASAQEHIEKWERWDIHTLAVLEAIKQAARSSNSSGNADG